VGRDWGMWEAGGAGLEKGCVLKGRRGWFSPVSLKGKKIRLTCNRQPNYKKESQGEGGGYWEVILTPYPPWAFIRGGRGLEPLQWMIRYWSWGRGEKRGDPGFTLASPG